MLIERDRDHLMREGAAVRAICFALDSGDRYRRFALDEGWLVTGDDHRGGEAAA